MGGELSPYFRSVKASIKGTKTPKTLFSGVSHHSLVRLNATAEAVLQAKITKSQPG